MGVCRVGGGAKSFCKVLTQPRDAPPGTLRPQTCVSGAPRPFRPRNLTLSKSIPLWRGHQLRGAGGGETTPELPYIPRGSVWRGVAACPEALEARDQDLGTFPRTRKDVSVKLPAGTCPKRFREPSRSQDVSVNLPAGTCPNLDPAPLGHVALTARGAAAAEPQFQIRPESAGFGR